jgi:hypothetical protein
VSGGKGVIDEDVAVLCKLGHEIRIVVFFTAVKARVFESRTSPSTISFDGLCGKVADAIGCEMNPVIEHVFDDAGNGGQ